MRQARIVFFAGISIVVAACGSKVIDATPGHGAEGDACDSENPCAVGLTCVDGLCVSSEPVSDGATPDAPSVVDSGQDSASNEAGPSYDVGSVSGLVLWARADKGLTVDADGGVTAWADQSSAHNDLVALSDAPLPYVDPSAVDGKPAVRMKVVSDTVSAALQTDTLTTWTTPSFIIAFVEKVSTGFGTGDFLKYETSDHRVELSFNCYSNATLAIDAFTLTDSKAFCGDGVPKVLVVRKWHKPEDAGPAITPTYELRLNGQVDVEHTEDILIQTTVPGLIGYRVDGDIPEAIIVQGNAADDVVQGIESYLMAKYVP